MSVGTLPVSEAGAIEPLAPIPIERIEAPLPSEFLRRYKNPGRPVVLTGVANNWRAMQTWSVPALRQLLNEQMVSTIPVRSGSLDINAKRGSKLRAMKANHAFDVLAAMEGQNADGAYIVCPMTALPSSITNDMERPVYCANARWLRSMLFVGAAKTITPLHQDLPDNIYVQVAGEKRWTIYPPRPNVMYRNSPFRGAPNHSRCDPENPDFVRFPEFRRAQPYVVDLKPGEALFLPSLWWHHVRALGPGAVVSVNFWWATGWRLPVARLAAAYKQWRGI